MSFALVLAAAVTLVVGLLQSGLTLIYVSIACSVVAGLVLALAVLRGRPESKPAGAGKPVSAPAASAPPAPTRSFEPPPARQPEPVSVGGGWTSASTTTDAPAPPAPAPAPPPRPAPAPAQDATQAAGAALLGRLRRKGGKAEPEAPQAAEEPAEAEEAAVAEAVPVEPAPERPDVTEEIAAAPSVAGDEFPMPDYDRLRATEIIGRLDTLDRDQLEQVREREVSTKNRFTVVSRVDARLEELQDGEWDIADDEWDSGGDEAVDADYSPVDVVVGSAGDDGGSPIPDYDSMRVTQILPLLATLSPEERDQVRRHEEQGRARSTILDRIRRLEGGDAGADAIVLPPPAPAAPKRAPRKRTAAVVAAPSEPVTPVKKARAPRKAAAPAAPVKAARRTAKAAPPAAKRGAAVKQAAAKKTTARATAPVKAAPTKLGAKKAGVKRAR